MNDNDRIRGTMFLVFSGRGVGGRGVGGCFPDYFFLLSVAMHADCMMRCRFAEFFSSSSLVQSAVYSVLSGQVIHFKLPPILHHNIYIFLLTCTESTVVCTIIKGPLSVCIVSTHSFLVYMTIRFDVLTRWYWGCWTFIKQIHISLKQQLTLPSAFENLHFLQLSECWRNGTLASNTNCFKVTKWFSHQCFHVLFFKSKCWRR